MTHYLKLTSRGDAKRNIYLQIYGSMGAVLDLIIANRTESEGYDMVSCVTPKQIAQWKEEAKQADKDLTSKLRISLLRAETDFARK